MRIADEIWKRLGDPHVYVECFGGRLDTLFCRPPTSHETPIEVVGDIDGMIVNFFRCARNACDQLAQRIDNDCLSTLDILARQWWLIDSRRLVGQLLADPEGFELAAAHYWLYHQNLMPDTAAIKGKRENVIMSFSPDLLKLDSTVEYLRLMAARLRKVRIIHGDWRRVLQETPRQGHYITGILFDPPYSKESDRHMGLYNFDSPFVARDAFKLAVRMGNDPSYRIAFCGFEGEFIFPNDWTMRPWSSRKAARANRGRERIWFSPGCLKVEDKKEAA